MKQFEFAKDFVSLRSFRLLLLFQPLEQVRVRQKQQNMFFGRIIRDQTGEQTLKQLKVANNAQLVIQVLPEPEFLEPNCMILLACKRNIAERTYGDKHEFKFTFTITKDKDLIPTIPELQEACKAHLGLPSSARVTIAKYVPHQFEWKWLNPDEEIIEKIGKKKKTELKIPGREHDLRKFPFFLNDGDIIGVRVDDEPESATDDLQTAADEVAKEEFRVEQEKEKADRAKQKKAGGAGGKNRGPEHGLVFNAGF